MADVLANLQMAPNETDATVVVCELPMVHANQTGPVQVQYNLVANSLTYRGNEEPKVAPAARCDCGVCGGSVGDNGVGIEAEHHAAILPPQTRLKWTAAEGSGLGLATAKRVMRNA